MKIVFAAARILLGLVFVVFGLNGFLNFIPQQPMPPGPAGQFAGALAQSHMFAAISALELLSGLLLWANRFTPLALTVLGAIIVNILFFHIFMAPASIAPGLVVTVLWLISAYRVRSAFAGLFLAKVEPSTGPTVAAAPAARPANA